jgi:rod shape determining protein RodA
MIRWRDFDYWLLVATLALMFTGFAMVYSATRGVEGLERLHIQQIIYGAIGLGAMLALAVIDYRFLEHFIWPIYAFCLLMLVAVLFKGKAIYGAQRWLAFGPITFQPSEPAKIFITIVLAAYFARLGEKVRSFRYVLLSLAIVAAPALLIYLQPDLGTTIVLGVIWLTLAWQAGVELKHLGFLGVVGVLLSPAIWFSLKDYMRKRILVFLNPRLDPGASYNLQQALISLGSGGFFGKGFARGSQSQLQFLRIRHTDFIFSVIGEELGFFGALLILSLLFVVVWRFFTIASRARDKFGSLIATGIGAIILFQVLVNVGMNMGLLPVTGIPLPFLSSGGSALLTFLCGEGLAQSISMRRKKLDFLP